MILLMSATANTILSFFIGISCGGIITAYWFGRESKKYLPIEEKSKTKIVYISDDVESSIVEPNVPDWKKYKSN